MGCVSVATTLPVPIEFRLPDGWSPAPPDEVAAPGAAFVAVHPDPDADFTANITIDGGYWPDTSLTAMADDSIHHLQEISEAVSLAHRSDVGSDDAPGLTQTLELSTVVNGSARDLVQAQVYLTMLDTNDPRQRAVIRLALTSTRSQYHAVLEDFQQFIRTVRPEGIGDDGHA